MMKLLVSLVLVALVSIQAEEINLGSGSTVCGTKRILSKEEILHFSSKGSAPDGACSMVLHAMEDTDKNCPYRSFCIAVNGMTMSTCSAKVFLTGTSYDVTGSNTKELSCYSNIFGAWCTQSRTLQISVLEDPKASSAYGFNFTVLSECRNSPSEGEFKPSTIDTSKKLSEIEESIKQNKIIGAVVGVCLACMFLVILFISYQYYRNKPTYRQQRDL